MEKQVDRVVDAKLTISQALFDGASIRDLLEIAEHFLDNPILLQDFTTRLLVYSGMISSPEKNTGAGPQPELEPPLDEIFSSVLTNGFVSADLFQKYDYANVLRTIENTPRSFVLESAHKPCRIICRLMVNNRYFGWIVAIAHRHPFLDGDLEIVDFLSGALSMLLERSDPSPASSQADRLLLELIGPNSYTEESFRARAAGFSWTLKGHYYVAVLACRGAPSGDLAYTMMAYKNHLALLFPNARCLFYEERLILLFDVPDRDNWQAPLLSFLEEYQLAGALSSPFSRILEFADRYHQAASALDIGTRLQKKGPLYCFDELTYYYAIQQLGKQDRLEYYCMPELIAAFRYDCKNGTNFALSVRAYLEYQGLAAASQALHVHRNTLLYRIGKFSEMFHLDLDDPAIRQRLQFSYWILELCPSMWKE